MNERPAVSGTARMLTLGTLVSSVLLLAGLATAAAGIDDATRLLSLGGVIALLATPAAGLVATALELRPMQPRSAVLALIVLGVLGVAIVVALVSR